MARFGVSLKRPPLLLNTLPGNRFVDRPGQPCGGNFLEYVGIGFVSDAADVQDDAVLRVHPRLKLFVFSGREEDGKGQPPREEDKDEGPDGVIMRVEININTSTGAGLYAPNWLPNLYWNWVGDKETPSKKRAMIVFDRERTNPREKGSIGGRASGFLSNYSW